MDTGDNVIPVYTFTPSSSGWTEKDTGNVGEYVYAYNGRLEPEESAVLSGTMTVNVGNRVLRDLEDSDMEYDIDGYAVGADEVSGEYSEIWVNEEVENR